MEKTSHSYLYTILLLQKFVLLQYKYRIPVTTKICPTLIIKVLALGNRYSEVRVYIPPKTVLDHAWSKMETQMLPVILCAAAKVTPKVIQNRVKAAKLYALCDELGMNHKGRCQMLHTIPSMTPAARNGNLFCSTGWKTPCHPISSNPPP